MLGVQAGSAMAGNCLYFFCMHEFLVKFGRSKVYSALNRERNPYPGLSIFFLFAGKKIIFLTFSTKKKKILKPGFELAAKNKYAHIFVFWIWPKNSRWNFLFCHFISTTCFNETPPHLPAPTTFQYNADALKEVEEEKASLLAEKVIEKDKEAGWRGGPGRNSK